MQWFLGAFVLLATPALLAAVAVLWMTSVPGRSHSGPSGAPPT